MDNEDIKKNFSGFLSKHNISKSKKKGIKMRILPLTNYQSQNQNNKKQNTKFGMMAGDKKVIDGLIELRKQYPNSEIPKRLGDWLQNLLNTYREKGLFEFKSVVSVDQNTDKLELLRLLESYTESLKYKNNFSDEEIDKISTNILQKVKNGDKVELELVYPYKRKLNKKDIEEIEKLITKAKAGNTIVSPYEYSDIKSLMTYPEAKNGIIWDLIKEGIACQTKLSFDDVEKLSNNFKKSEIEYNGKNNYGEFSVGRYFDEKYNFPFSISFVASKRKMLS